MSKAKKFKNLIKKKALPYAGKEATKKEWVADLASLFKTISVWMEEEEIEYRVHSNDFDDPTIGQYRSSILVIVQDDYEATIRPEYTAPRGGGAGVVIKAGKKSGSNSKRLIRDKSDGTTKWKVPINSSSAVRKKLTMDRFFDLLISVFRLEE